MRLTTQALSQDEALARWAELCLDPAFGELDARCEMDEFGVPCLTPPPSFRHQLLANRLAVQLRAQLQGEAVVECPVYAGKTFIADVVWMSTTQSMATGVAAVAPPLVIEVVSPGNLRHELEAKVPAYLTHGVTEVILVELDGSVRFFAQAGERTESALGVRLQA